MEDWEKELRAKLDKEIAEGSYRVSIAGMASMLMSKEGFIEFEVAVERFTKIT